MQSAKHPKARLQHILQQIDGVEAAIRDLSFDEVRDSFLHLRAIERAPSDRFRGDQGLPAALRDRSPDVHWPPIIKIGNLLRHEHYRMNDRDMCEIAAVHLPQLRPVILRMLDDIDRADEQGG